MSSCLQSLGFLTRILYAFIICPTYITVLGDYTFLNVITTIILGKSTSCTVRDYGNGLIPHILLHSTLGHYLPPAEIGLTMYAASKHAVTALTEGLRRELLNLKSKIRVTVSNKLHSTANVHFLPHKRHSCTASYTVNETDINLDVK